ncbi:tyrosine-type recombinase/integrase [Sorangium sp. So ce362]|uniref:tyrosine-type recombinase/integrase n=1 Tax=Sorangium sp. So ce362 TaxID=3133303 RepID=UPI003F62423A
MPIYPKAGRRGTWRVVMSVRGRQREWTIRGMKSEAEVFQARKRLELEAGDLAEVRIAPKFSDFCVSRYRPHAEMHLRASTWKVRAYQLATLIEHFGELRLTAITTGQVEAFKRGRLADGRGARTINNELAVLQAVCTYAREIPVPIARFAIQPLPVRGRGRVTFWSEAQVAALYEALEELSPELLPIVVCLMNTGMRKGEALALTWEHVDLERGHIRIWPSPEWQPKDNEPREVPIGDALLPWLRRERVSTWVFPCSTGERWRCWPKLQFDRARRAAGHDRTCPVWLDHERACLCGAKGLRGGPHTARHTFAAHFLKAVPDMYLLSQILGHSETRTSKLYAHLLPEHLERARGAVSLVPDVGAAEAAARRRWG